jgi:hypothetical protein
MLIGLSGFAGSGKDAVGSYLESRYGYRKIRFAALLKAQVAQLFGFTEQQIEGALKEVPDRRYPMTGFCPECDAMCSSDPAGWFCESCKRIFTSHLTPRLAMQVHGSMMRALYPSIWIDATLRGIYGDERVVVVDVRYANEAHAIRERGGRVARLLRGKPESSHPSETELIDRHDCYDTAIDNRETTIAEMRARVDACMREWGVAPVGEA